jgi:hypothetical protein
MASGENPWAGSRHVDYEDAVIHEAARLINADGIVTRDDTDFQQATLPVYSPVDLLNLLNIRSEGK